ncbi:MAG: hypothetical protein ACK56I_29595, partial [bacterium]
PEAFPLELPLQQGGPGEWFSQGGVTGQPHPQDPLNRPARGATAQARAGDRLRSGPLRRGREGAAPDRATTPRHTPAAGARAPVLTRCWQRPLPRRLPRLLMLQCPVVLRLWC